MTAVGQADVRTDGLVTLPALMQRVQTFMRLVVEPTCTRMRWMFGFQRRLVRRWEWLRLMPKIGFLSQTSQTAAMVLLSLLRRLVAPGADQQGSGVGAVLSGGVPGGVRTDRRR